MLNQLKLGTFLGVAAGVFAICLGAATADASNVADIEAAQSNAPALKHQYKFEGMDDSTRLADSKGSLDLEKVAGPGGAGTVDPDMTPDTGDEYMYDYPAGDVSMIGFEPGLDGASSQAYRPQKNAAATSADGGERVAQSRSGAGLVAQTFSTPSKITVETIVSPDAWVDTANALAYIAQTRPGTADRGYFLAQTAPTGSRADGNLTGIVGSNFGDRPTIVQDYDAGDWFYVAVTYDLSATPTAVGNAYYRNLTADGPLVHAVVDHGFTFNGSLPGSSGPLGVGLFAIGSPATSAQEFLNGAIDNLAIYGTVLSAEQIERHSRGVPEPASLLLVSVGGLALLGLRRRYR